MIGSVVAGSIPEFVSVNNLFNLKVNNTMFVICSHLNKSEIVKRESNSAYGVKQP